MKLSPQHKGIDINCFVDSDWAGDPDSRKSTSGVSLFVLGANITAHSRAQQFVALSSGEAELYAIGGGVADSLFIRSLVTESINFFLKSEYLCFRRLNSWQINGGTFWNLAENKTRWTAILVCSGTCSIRFDSIALGSRNLESRGYLDQIRL